MATTSEAPLRKRDRTRQALLTAAQEIVLEKGLQSVSLQEITDRAGVAMGTFYNYFRTREDVGDAIAELLQRAYHEDIDAVVAGISDPLRVVSASTRQTLAWLVPGSDVGRLLFASGVPFLRFALDVRQRAGRDVAAGIEVGVFHVDSLAATQSALAGIVTGAAFDLYFGGLDTEAIPEVTQAALRVLGVPPARAKKVVSEPLALRAAPRLPLDASRYLVPLDDGARRRATSPSDGAPSRTRPTRRRPPSPRGTHRG